MNESGSALDRALRSFEAAEANLGKLERLWAKISAKIPRGIVFDSNSEYDDLIRTFEEVKEYLPAIDGWRVTSTPYGLGAIAQGRLDARELDEVGAVVSTEEAITAPGAELATYRLRLQRKRRQVVRDTVKQLLTQIEKLLETLWEARKSDTKLTQSVPQADWEVLKQLVAQVDSLLGSAVKRPLRWDDLLRHLSFGLYGDLSDIIRHDWPKVRPGIATALYDDSDPVAADVADLAGLVGAKPTGPVSTRLRWDSLDAEAFERLIFELLRQAAGYENPQWLMRTNAPDRGRDLSCDRVVTDELSGTKRDRVIIQCRHWLDRSISVHDIATLREQVVLWDPPPRVLIIATSGRFSSDAVASIEKSNATDQRLSIEMWPESHLESLLASRPALIAEFGLR
jgi:hypothetical protein